MVMVFNETDCILAGEIYRSKSYNAVLGILIGVNTFAVLIVLKAGIVLYKAKSFHFNLRMLILNIAMAILARTSLTTTRAVMRITHAIIEDNACNFLSTKLRCTAESTLQSLPLETVACTFPIVCLERFIATVWSEKYEKRRWPFLVFIGIAATWFYPSYVATTTILNEKRQTFVPYCSTVTEATSINYKIFLSFYFELPLFCIFICTILCLYCKYKKGSFMKTRSTEHSLTARYQLTEIIKTTRYVIPLCVVLCFLLFIQIIILFVSVETFKVKDLQTFSVIKEVTSLLVMPIFAIFFGFMFYLRHRLQYCNHLQTCFGLRRGIPIQPVPNETDLYFKLYANEWK